MWEVILILVVALIFLGPRQLAETAQVLGKMYRELQKMMWDIRNSVDLDSLTSTETHHNDPPRQNHEDARQVVPKGDLVPPPGEKTGPDFYAELIEKAAEDEKKENALDSGEPQEKEQEKIDDKMEPKQRDSRNGLSGT